MEKSFLNYIHVQIKAFRKNFIQSITQKNFNEIHDYRVALKRIRTLVNFIKRIPGGRNLKKCYKINNLELAFKSGGILREMQINRIILNQFEQKSNLRYSKFRQYIRHREKNALKDLKYAREKFSAAKLNRFESKVGNTIKNIPTHLFQEHIDKFITNKITQIKELVKDQNVESTLHRIRRHTKSIKYLLEISQTTSRSYGDLKFEADKITDLEDLIGQWHDQLVFKTDLQKYISSLQKRKVIDPPSLKLADIVEAEYSSTFNNTVQAVYDHYKIPASH